MTIPQNIYMIGIGGIGMSALAQLLKHEGKQVCGSDREESPTTDMLREKGIDFVIGQDSSIPDGTELLIYSDAVPADNPARAWARDKGIPQTSYFEALGEVSKTKRTIAVSGTHGKTTTTAMLARILEAAGKDPTVIVGSIVSEFGSNFRAGGGAFVVEACEYRDHMLELAPEILVITNIELDHTDFFPSLSALQSTFRSALERVPENGFVVTAPSDESVKSVIGSAKAKVVDYAKESVPELSLIGEFNAMNARAAKAAARAAFPDISDAIADKALRNFKGTWRRFEYKGETPEGALVYDDYAHHPTAVAKTIQAARERFPDKRIVVAFHPHLYSRTKSFLKEFAEALSKADAAIVAPIYAARETPDPNVSNHALARAAEGGSVVAVDSFDEIRDRLLKEKEGALILTMGAGDIYKVAEQIVEE